MQLRTAVVETDHAGFRLDRFLVEVFPDISRSLAQKLITAGEVTVDEKPAKSSARLVAGQKVALHMPQPQSLDLEPEPIPLQIVFDNQDLVVIDKPAGLVVHPAAGHATGTLVNALLSRYPDLVIGNSLRPGIVHRLDKDTSGLMVVAKNDTAQQSLSRQIKDHEMLKEYLALVHGHISSNRGTIDAPIARDPKTRQRMAIVHGGRASRTHFSISERFTAFDLLEVRLETGRTHQIRVHLASIGHPVAGDKVYGHADEQLGLPRQFLHAYRLGFRLPGTEEYVEFTSALPTDLEAVLQTLRKAESGR